MNNCKVCNNITSEITIYNGETKYFCSIKCVETQDLIEAFKEFIQSKFNKYQYLHKDDLIKFLYPEINKNIIYKLTAEVLNRGYFSKDNKGFIYPKNKIIHIPLEK